MKPDKNTLIEVKYFLSNQDGWELEEIVEDILSETKLLSYYGNEEDLISPDECDIESCDGKICNLQSFISVFSEKFIEKICNVLDSFVDEDIEEENFSE